MTEQKKSEDSMRETQGGIDRRNFLLAGAAGVAGVGAGVSTAAAQQGGQGPWTNSPTGIRTAVITDTQMSIGPHLARKMAALNYNLVIADVLDGLPEELRRLGATEVVTVPGLEQEGPNNESKPGSLQRVVDTAMDRFGGFDSAFIRTAIHAPQGDILNTSAENLMIHYEQNCLAAMFGLQAVLPPLVAAGAGQVVVQTSATGQKPQPTMIGYSTMRAAANMICRCAAMTVAPNNVSVNVIGTNFMNYPGFRDAAGAQDEAVYQRLLNVIPMRRLGETEEAAHLALSLLDGYNMYTTGNAFPVAGGFNNEGMAPFG